MLAMGTKMFYHKNANEKVKSWQNYAESKNGSNNFVNYFTTHAIYTIFIRYLYNYKGDNVINRKLIIATKKNQTYNQLNTLHIHSWLAELHD